MEARIFSLEEPTRATPRARASTKARTEETYLRVQLLTIEGLLSGQAHAGHLDYEPDLNLKKARTESHSQ